MMPAPGCLRAASEAEGSASAGTRTQLPFAASLGLTGPGPNARVQVAAVCGSDGAVVQVAIDDDDALSDQTGPWHASVRRLGARRSRWLS